MLAGRKLVILFVEDDIDDIFLCQTAVERANLNVDLRVIHTVDEAIDWLASKGPFQDREQYPVPDMVITDLRTPEQSGLELVRWMRESKEYHDVPVIIHSGSFSPGEVSECLNLGATAAIVKEPLCKQLVETIMHTMATVTG